MSTMHYLLHKLYTRRCRGCADPSPHSHHLTLLGRMHYGRMHYTGNESRLQLPTGIGNGTLTY